MVFCLLAGPALQKQLQTFSVTSRGGTNQRCISILFAFEWRRPSTASAIFSAQHTHKCKEDMRDRNRKSKIPTYAGRPRATKNALLLASEGLEARVILDWITREQRHMLRVVPFSWPPYRHRLPQEGAGSEHDLCKRRPSARFLRPAFGKCEQNIYLPQPWPAQRRRRPPFAAKNTV